MREVVLDPELIAAGVLGRPQPRRLLALLAYGRWVQYARLLGPAEAALVEEELRAGGTAGPLTIDALVEQAHNQGAKLNELLDYGAPDDLVLVASDWVVAAVIARVEIARRLEPAAGANTSLAEEARRIVRFLALGSMGNQVGADQATDSLRDHLVHLAAMSSAPLISDDEALAPGDDTMWRHIDPRGGRPAFVVTTTTFIEAQVDRSPFSLDTVPYDLLNKATEWITDRLS